MTYKLTFLKPALKEWKKLAPDHRKQFEKKLHSLRSNPHVPAARLRDLPNCYKIKLRDAGYRLVYRVYDERIVIQIVAVGRRDKNEVYEKAAQRIK
jgi:mRNA interferase RelE/StbE